MADELAVIATEDCERAGFASEGERDVDFPTFIDGWTDILDCRHPPYSDQSLETNCEFAEHVRKPYLLVPAERLEEDEAPAGGS